MALQSWLLLWAKYPDYIYYSSPDVKAMIGGSVNQPYVQNTCAVRMCRTLNYNGVTVPHAFGSGKAFIGGDKKRYFYLVADMRNWLPFALGKPDFDLKKAKGKPFEKSSIAGLKGLLVFDIGFGDATGHCDLWNGKRFSSETTTSTYWSDATRITLWKASEK